MGRHDVATVQRCISPWTCLIGTLGRDKEQSPCAFTPEPILLSMHFIWIRVNGAEMIRQSKMDWIRR